MLYYCFRELFCKIMISTSSILRPVDVRGMKVVDKVKFLRNIQVPVLKVKEQNLSKITSLCKPYFLKLENFKPVQNIESDIDIPLNKYLHFNPEKVNKWTDISEDHRTLLNEYGVTEANLQTIEVQFTYDNWRFETIFKAVLPENEEIVSSYSQIGHIIHLNLREHLLEYRPLIGQVLLDKIKTCRTVVNKNNIIDNNYRNFSMEVIAGDEDFFVTVKENRCIFQFDFSKVYWNPRLGKEHERILSYFKPSDILFDVFCGVGPFSVPAAKRKSYVYANDLNPDSFKWLNHNAKFNKVKSMYFNSYNLDGKDFICTVFKNYVTEYCKDNSKIQDGATIHVTMNLPAMAVEFLSNFKGLIKDQELIDKFNCTIIIYVYCFTNDEDPVSAAKKMVIDNIGCDISADIIDVLDVRNVSPKKEMMRVMFRLTNEVLFDLKSECSEPPLKKQCVIKE